MTRLERELPRKTAPMTAPMTGSRAKRVATMRAVARRIARKSSVYGRAIPRSPDSVTMTHSPCVIGLGRVHRRATVKAGADDDLQLGQPGRAPIGPHPTGHHHTAEQLEPCSFGKWAIRTLRGRASEGRSPTGSRVLKIRVRGGATNTRRSLSSHSRFSWSLFRRQPSVKPSFVPRHAPITPALPATLLDFASVAFSPTGPLPHVDPTRRPRPSRP